MDIKELIEARNKVWDDMRTFLDSKQNAEGLLSEEDGKTYDKMQEKLDSYGVAIERAEKLANITDKLSQPTRNAILSVPNSKSSKNSKEYSKEFWNSLKIKNYNSIGTDADGGYLVPDEFERTLVEKLEEENVIRNLATVIRTSSGDRQIPVVASDTEATLTAEGTAYAESDPTFSQVILSAYKITILSKVSEELLYDSAFNIEQFLANEYGRRLAAKEEELFCTGTGTNQPTGIFTAATTGVTSKTATITFDDILDLFYSVKAPYRKNGSWLLNDSTVKALRKLKDTTGNYIWTPSVQAGVPDMILNRPFYTSVFAPALEDKKAPVAFGDFSYYWIGDRETRSIKKLDQLYAEKDLVGFKIRERVDANLILPEAVKTLKIDSASK